MPNLFLTGNELNFTDLAANDDVLYFAARKCLWPRFILIELINPSLGIDTRKPAVLIPEPKWFNNLNNLNQAEEVLDFN